MVTTRVLEYPVAWNRTRGRCAVSAWPDPRPRGRARRGLVIVTELPANPGPSVTNAIEEIAEALELHVLPYPIERYALVEHYPANSFRGATFDLVTLRRRREDWAKVRFAEPHWRRLTADELDDLAPTPPAPSRLFVSEAPRTVQL